MKVDTQAKSIPVQDKQKSSSEQLGKFTTLENAIKRFVKNGSHISLGGSTANRNPMAAVYEIIRQQIKELYLYGVIMGPGPDLLIGAGCISAVEFGYFGIGRYAPTAPSFKRFVEQGLIRFEDYTNYQIGLRFLAGAMGIPFIAAKSSLGSDIIEKWGLDDKFRQSDERIASKKLLIMRNPFNQKFDEKVVLLPAINPDVTIIHAQKVDREGNVRIEGLSFSDVEQAKASKYLIVTCEEVCDNETLRSQPQLNQIPSYFPDAIVKIPTGAHPTQCYNYYDLHVYFLNCLIEASKNETALSTFLEDYVYGVSDHGSYLAKVGDEPLEEIKADPWLGYKRNLKRKKLHKPKLCERKVNEDHASFIESMAIAASREIKNSDIVFCGTGLPILAARAAKLIHAPRSIIFFETGSIDPPLFDLPMFVADSRVMTGAAMHLGLVESLSMLQNNKIGPRLVSILGAAQIDRYGNLNTTCVGAYLCPKIRFPGSGGGSDAACLAERVIVFMKHEKNRFVEKLDYVTSPGWVSGGKSRWSKGLDRGGTSVVITEKCILRFSEDDKTMYLSEYFTGCDKTDIMNTIGFELDISQATEIAPPTSKELIILREKVDPEKLFIK